VAGLGVSGSRSLREAHPSPRPNWVSGSPDGQTSGHPVAKPWVSWASHAGNFGSSTLTFLNISHNDIETFPSFALFPSQRLRVFDARRNAPEFTISYAGLGPAMRYCGDRGPPLVLLDDSDHCYSVGKTAEGIGSCYYVGCGHYYGRREECDDGVKRFVPLFTECDGIDDGCQDESFCLPSPAFRSSEGSSEQDPFCQDIADCSPVEPLFMLMATSPTSQPRSSTGRTHPVPCMSTFPRGYFSLGMCRRGDKKLWTGRDG